MREVTIKVYPFSELSEESKTQAVTRYRDAEDHYFLRDEAYHSLETFCQHFKLDLGDAIFDLYQPTAVWGLEDSELSKMQGVRVWKYLNNQGFLENDLLSGDCPFTGCYFDEVLLDEIRAFIKAPISDKTLTELFEDCIASLFEVFTEEGEYRETRTAIIDSIEAHDYKFTANGAIYRAPLDEIESIK